MEYLVTMSTHVPDGTPAQEVDDVRAREAAHTRELAAQGHVLRLWRPPLAPGEWRTIGLFAADGAAELAQVLASMPLRVWRSDEIEELGAHPNDPAPGAGAAPPADGEFLVTFASAVPAGTAAATVEEAKGREAERVAELAKQGTVVRLWTLPAAPGAAAPPPPAPGVLPPALGLFRAGSAAGMQAVLDTLPLQRYLTVGFTELTPHPSDPAAPGSRPRRTGTGRG
ncbi:MAG TPA: muconolactone Delta-isomerase family protein [Trebonia sp.]|jgi:muconolactone delta-isomerase|nr:muconolactone Delta-isomerase family protein [Trebonia sp.]